MLVFESVSDFSFRRLSRYFNLRPVIPVLDNVKEIKLGSDSPPSGNAAVRHEKHGNDVDRTVIP